MRTSKIVAGWNATKRIILGLAVVAGLGGCVQHPTATGTWQDGARRGQAYSRVLVVGVSPNLRSRCKFERYLAGQIASEDTEAFTSCDTLEKDQREPITRESIEKAVAAQHADAVVATVLVAKEVNVAKGGSRDTRGSAGYKATDAGWSDGYYGMYGVPVIYGEFQSAAEISTIQADITVSSRLFDTRGPRLVYTVETTARRLESQAEGLSSITGPIAERLRDDGLIR
jgi:hypothetical protein